MSNKQGTAWIQNLNKQELITELEKRGFKATEQSKVDELRKVLREDCKSKEQSRKDKIERTMAEFTAKLEFKIGTDSWEEFVERIELYFEANEIEEEGKKRALLLTKMDAETYSAVRKVCAPKKPSETPLKDIITKMDNYLKPKVNVTVLRQRFREKKQGKNESAIQYLAALRDLARECKFKEEEEALLDQFITGMACKAIKIALFKAENLTLDVAIKTATAIEGANKAAETGEPAQPSQEKEGTEKEEEDNKTFRIQPRYRPRRAEQSRGRKPRERQLCLCCGKPNHQRRDCWHRDRECDKCGKKGHLKAVCTAVKAGDKKNQVKNVAAKYETSETESEPVSQNKLLSTNYRSNKIRKIQPQYLQICVDNRTLEMEVDGGSSISLISEQDRLKYFPKWELNETSVVLSYYSGEKRKPKGVLRDIEIGYGTVTTKVNLYVVGETGRPLMGRDWLYALKLWPFEIKQKKTEGKVLGIETGNKGRKEEVGNRGGLLNARKEIFKKYNQLFSSGLGTYNKAKFVIRMKTDAKPVYYKARSIPLALKGKVEAELERLCKEGVLSPVEASEWGTPVVPIIKPDGTVRLCGDYKVTVNPNIIIDRHPLPKIELLVASLQKGYTFQRLI